MILIKTFRMQTQPPTQTYNIMAVGGLLFVMTNDNDNVNRGPAATRWDVEDEQKGAGDEGVGKNLNPSPNGRPRGGRTIG